jgi:acyl-CoA thioester hydrolase
MRNLAWEDDRSIGETEVRVRVADTDLMGVVYNSNYLIWFEIGRTELLRDRGMTYGEIEARGYSLPVTEASFRVRKPARYDDLLNIKTQVGDLRSRRLSFRYRIFRGQSLLVEGETVHVPVLHSAGGAISLPSWLTDVLGLVNRR